MSGCARVGRTWSDKVDGDVSEGSAGTKREDRNRHDVISSLRGKVRPRARKRRGA